MVGGSMTSGKRAQTVYSTEQGRVCPRCGWPVKKCQCSSNQDQPIPERIIVRLRIERAGRKGKTVTVLEGLPSNAQLLKTLTKQLKRACGTGGTLVESRIELQGDHREQLRSLLRERGWTVKG
jgi:translation initiation factor 1